MEFEKLLKILACPACKSDLTIVRKNEDQGFACPHCQVVYPIKEDIPIMIVEEAIPFEIWEDKKL